MVSNGLTVFKSAVIDAAVTNFVWIVEKTSRILVRERNTVIKTGISELQSFIGAHSVLEIARKTEGVHL